MNVHLKAILFQLSDTEEIRKKKCTWDFGSMIVYNGSF